MAPITAQRTLERIEFAGRGGFDVHAFLRHPGQAERVGEAWLERRLNESTVHAFNNDTKWLNALADWAGWAKEVRFRTRPEPRPEFKALATKEIRRALAYRHAMRDVERLRRAVFLMALETGMRASEVAALTLEDVDEDHSLVHVRKPAKRGPKRWVPVSRWIWSPKRPVGAYLAWRRDQVMEVDRIGDGRALWVTTITHGGRRRAAARPVSQDYLRMSLYRMGQDLGLRLNFVVTRHTLATQLHRRGFDVLAIAAVLGHASLESTRVYTELSPEDLFTLFRRRPAPDYYQQRGGWKDAKKTGRNR